MVFLSFFPALILDESSPYPDLESFYQPSSAGQYLCLSCGYKARKFDMRKHVQRKHLKKVKYPCSLCDSESASEVDRKRHYMRTHNLTLSLAEIATLKRSEEYWLFWRKKSAKKHLPSKFRYTEINHLRVFPEFDFLEFSFGGSFASVCGCLL